MIDFNDYDLENEIEKINKFHKKIDENEIALYSAKKILHDLYNIPKHIDIDAFPFHSIFMLDYEYGNPYFYKKCPILTNRKSQMDYLINNLSLSPEQVFCTGGLFPMYRRLKGIEKSEKAKGILICPFHSTQGATIITDYKKLIDKLNDLPERFKPINICMYWKDIMLGYHQLFLDNGFKVYTAGHFNDPDFVDNFYEILRHHNYSASNSETTNTSIYSLEMGIPAFIYGNETYLNFKITDNWNNTDIQNYYAYLEKSVDEYQKIIPKYPNVEITDSIEKMIYEKCGLNYQSPKKVVREAIISYSRDKWKRDLIVIIKKIKPSIKKFIYNKEHKDGMSFITILELIKFQYKSKKTKIKESLNVYEEDFEEQANTGYESAEKVIKLFTKYYQPESVLDVGCGVGAWLKAWSDTGVKEIKGLDMNSYSSSNLLISEENLETVDLNNYEKNSEKKYSLAMSLEVAEHIEPRNSETFITLLTGYSDVILFSAAIPYQPGTEHINCQPLKLWVNLFNKKGFVCFDILRKDLMEDEDFPDWWYAQNILVFVRETKKELFEKQGLKSTKNPMFFYCPEHVDMLISLAKNESLN